MGVGRRVANVDNNDVMLPEGFRYERKLGQGGQGTVVLARDIRPEALLGAKDVPYGLDPKRYDPTRVAIKCYPRSLLTDPSRRNQIRREVRTLRLLQHPHVIGFREVCLSKTHLCLITDYAAGGSLFDVLCAPKTHVLTEGVAKRLFQQIITGLDYAHKRGFTNRDIKPDNILFYPGESGKSPIVVLCDFGLSRRDTSGLILTMEGTCGYLAPELFSGHCKSVDQMKQADLYSCGVVLYQMLYGIDQRPLGPGNKGKGRIDMKIMRSWLHGEYMNIQLPDLRYVSEECRDFLNGILQPNPKNRLTMEKIWKHPWFKTDVTDKAMKWNRKMLTAHETKAVQQSHVDDELRQLEAIMEEASPIQIKSRACGFPPLKRFVTLKKSLSRTAT